jgi:hypothetical protein
VVQHENNALCCHFCGLNTSSYIRRGFLRPIDRAKTIN